MMQEALERRFPLVYDTLEEWDSPETPTVEACLVAQRARTLRQAAAELEALLDKPGWADPIFTRFARNLAAEWRALLEAQGG